LQYAARQVGPSYPVNSEAKRWDSNTNPGIVEKWITGLGWKGPQVDKMLILELLVLLVLANGTPVIARNSFAKRLAWPLDGGIKIFDGQPLFGSSKTVRGLVLAVLVTGAGGALMGLGWQAGLVIGSLSMAGDLFSSFFKRRMKLPPSSRALGLDQVPESLFPLLACQGMLELTVTEIVTVVVIFFAGDVILSPLFFKWKIRKRPY
jgi:CDP-2,3-bis-(O-geranylgeranyl)-sn-glycerol synthase